jgi:tetratricopeptide (TPR) repeat protein
VDNANPTRKFERNSKMSRKLIISALLLTMVFTIGCEDQTVSGDPRYMVSPAQATIATSQGFAIPGATEVDLVEYLAGARQEYKQSVERLMKYYRASGNAQKLQWSQHELKALGQVPNYRYIMPAGVLPANLVPRDDIEEANILYTEAMNLYKEAGGLLIITDEGKLRGALNKFNELIMAYQTSNKIDDAAYRAGRIYEHFQDFQIAAVYYQRCFQWNDITKYPARFRAGFLLDQRLHMRKEALTLYQLAVDREKRYTANTEFAHRRILEMTKVIPTPGAPRTRDTSDQPRVPIDSFTEQPNNMP